MVSSPRGFEFGRQFPLSSNPLDAVTETTEGEIMKFIMNCDMDVCINCDHIVQMYVNCVSNPVDDSQSLSCVICVDVNGQSHVLSEYYPNVQDANDELMEIRENIESSYTR